jgi:hypothetical protein
MVGTDSAEILMWSAEARCPELARDVHFLATRALIGAVRKGGSYKAVDPCLVLRALATFTDHTPNSSAALLFLADAPTEIAWNVLSWWDVKVPGEY